jgi:hypothetical protein
LIPNGIPTIMLMVLEPVLIIATIFIVIGVNASTLSGTPTSSLSSTPPSSSPQYQPQQHNKNNDNDQSIMDNINHYELSIPRLVSINTMSKNAQVPTSSHTHSDCLMSLSFPFSFFYCISPPYCDRNHRESWN